MKKLLIILIMMLCSYSVVATEQVKDNIILNGEKGQLEMSWQYPGPIENYFKKNEKKYPFEGRSTANYRGHIATWEISDEKLYLNEIGIQESFFSDDLNMIALNEIFPNSSIKHNRVEATWFSGYLLAHTDMEQVTYVSPEGEVSDIKYNQYQKKIILRVINGKVVESKSFDYDEYWSLVTKSYQYNHLDIESRKIIHEYLTYNSSFLSEEEKELMFEERPSKQVLTEDDFDVLLKRAITKNVSIPLSDLAVIRDVTFNAESNGWHSEQDYKIKNGSSVLYMEMGSTNIPSGPWSNYVGGSLQVAMHLKDLTVGKKEISIDEVKYINNFAHSEKQNKTIEIDIKIDEVSKQHLLLSGKVIFRSQNPSTYQEIEFKKDKIPIFELLDYLQIHQNDSEYFPYKAEKLYEKIKNKSK